jgi:nucleoside-diphosphate-sugar epimerase
VHLGSAYELGPSTEALTEEAPLQPLGVYGAAKAAGWLVLEQLAAAHGGGLTGLRLYTQYGPGDDPRRLIPGVVDAVKRGVPIDLSSGTQRRDFVWVGDVARLITGLLDHGAPEGLFHVCTGRPLSVRDAAAMVARCGGGEHLLRFGTAIAHEGAARDVIGDSTRLERWCRNRGLDHLVAWTSLEDGARQLFAA